MPTLLILAASPLDQKRLRLGNEVKRIKEVWQRSHNRSDWKIEDNVAATVDDLLRHLVECQPTVLHFSGHGGGQVGLCFEDDQGSTQLAQANPLARLFHNFKDKLKCVVLNACFSQVQAEAIRNNIDYVVGMKSSVLDDTATKFAVHFYTAVFAGTNFRTAFNIGSSSLDLGNVPDADVPILLTSPQLGGIELPYTEDVPEIENLLHTYLNTPYHERGRFTTKGDKLNDAIKRHYGEMMQPLVNKVTVITKKQIDNLYWKVAVRVSSIGKNKDANYYLRIDGKDIKVDWEASVGYWSVPVKTYLALGTRKPIVARVTAELGDFYLGDDSVQRFLFQNIRIATIGGETLNAYVLRRSECFEELKAILDDGNPHEVTLAIGNHADDIRYKVIGNRTDDTRHPIIHEVLSQSWIVPDDAQAVPTSPTP